MTGNVHHSVEAAEVQVAQGTLQNLTPGDLQTVLQQVDQLLVNTLQPLLVPLYYAGQLRAGEFIVGQDTAGMPADRAGTVTRLTCQFRTALTNVMTVRVANITTGIQTYFIFTGNGLDKYLVGIGAPLPVNQGDQLSLQIESLHNPTEPGGDASFILLIS